MNEQEIEKWLKDNLPLCADFGDDGKWHIWFDDVFELCYNLLEYNEWVINMKGGRP